MGLVCISFSCCIISRLGVIRDNILWSWLVLAQTLLYQHNSWYFTYRSISDRSSCSRGIIAAYNTSNILFSKGHVKKHHMLGHKGIVIAGVRIGFSHERVIIYQMVGLIVHYYALC